MGEIQNIFDFAGPRVSGGTQGRVPVLIVWRRGTLQEASKHLVARRDPRRRVLGSHKMVPWWFWPFCKAKLAGKQ